MKVSCFKDGESFVMVFDGLTSENENTLIKKFGATRIGDVDAKVEHINLLEDTPDIPISERKFTFGPLKGYTVNGAFQAKGSYAFRVLSQQYFSGEITGEEKEFIGGILNAYIKEMFSVPPESIQAQIRVMDDVTVDDFIVTFSDALISDRMWQAIPFSKGEFMSQDLEMKRTTLSWVCSQWSKRFYQQS